MKGRPRLLVLEPRRLGDALLSVPLVRSAQERFEVYVCCPPGSAAIYSAIIPTSHIIILNAPWEKRGGSGWFSKNFQEGCQKLNKLQFDVLISVWPDVRVHLWLNLIRAQRRLGFMMNKHNYYAAEQPSRGRKLKLGIVLGWVLSLIFNRPLLTSALKRKDRSQPHLENWHQVASELGLEWKIETPWFEVRKLSTDHPLSSFIKEARREKKVLWLFHTGASSEKRRWPLERFAALLEQLSRKSELAVMVINAPGEPQLKVGRTWQIAHNTLNLEELFMLTAEVDQVLCHDTMMSHLAGALGKNVHTLFGSANPDWFAPFGNRDRLIIHDICPHRPCFDKCVFPSPICIESIQVEEVIRRVDSIS